MFSLFLEQEKNDPAFLVQGQRREHVFLFRGCALILTQFAKLSEAQVFIFCADNNKLSSSFLTKAKKGKV
jgi:hypothetical protein